MTEDLFVLMHNVSAGRLARRANALRFAYDPEYLRNRGRTPLSVTLPLRASRHTDKAVMSWLWGLLPDNDAVIARWARQFQVARSPFALLGTPIGEDCAGAARFVKASRLDDALAGRGHVDWLDEAGVAGRLRDLRLDTTTWLGADFSGRFSLAGAQAKTALLYEPGRWGVPSGAAATSHILKPAIAGLDDHDLNEHLCLRAARHAGMPAVRSEIQRFEDQSVVVAERYDRVVQATGWLGRVHQEDLCQATGRAPQAKYQNDGGPTPTEIVQLLRRVLPGVRADEAGPVSLIWPHCDGLIWPHLRHAGALL